MKEWKKQCLLAYLGYLPYRDIDGIWGNQSRKATEAFQRDFQLTVDGKFGPNTEKRILEVIYNQEEPPKATTEESSATGTFWDEIEFFDREEFRCKCGGKYCNGFLAEPQEKLIRVADRVRSHFGTRITVSSGVRCPTHNANVGGAANSRHKLGKAMDFTVSGFSAAMVLAYVQQQPEIRYAYAINSNYVHMDIE